MGTVHSFGFVSNPFTVTDEINREIPVVFVQMDLRTGCSIDTDNNGGNIAVNNLIPVCAIASITKIQNKYTRWQLPLLPAHARTVHSAQGITATEGAIIYPISMGLKHFARALEYVMTSRPTSADDIYLMEPLTLQHFNDFNHSRACIREEYSRLRTLFPM